MAQLNGQVIIVTGATNGIGKVAARELAKMGATTVLIARNESKAQQTVAEIKNATGNQNVDYLIADLSLMAEVRQVAEAFRAKYDRLDVLLNNAGAFFSDYGTTAEGYERTFALNHLNYFLLTNLLLDMLKDTGTPLHNARIVNVSSGVHYNAKVDYDNLQGEKGYKGLQAYSISKLENILFTYELARQLKDAGAHVTVNALHPGMVATGFGHNNNFFVNSFMSVLHLFAISEEKGAETSIYLASSPEVEGVTGKYFDKSKPKASSDASMKQEDWRRLWQVSEELTGLKTLA